jgi:hypothetical protein
VRARDNPFAAQRILRLRYRLSGTSWEEVLERLAALGHRAAVVGPHGRGKSTFLEDLRARLEDRGLHTRAVVLHRGERRLTPLQEESLFAGLSREDVLLLDGAEQLGRLAWLRVRRRSLAAGGLVVTSHRPGLLPTLIDCRTSPELLASILRDLLGPEAETLAPAAEELFARHGGNLRHALRELYDLYASR